jgi:hypothetical protein
MGIYIAVRVEIAFDQSCNKGDIGTNLIYIE